MPETDLETLRGLADPTRREIVARLSAGGLAVREIAAGLPMSRPAVSKHLRVLREHGLVVETKVGRERVYELVAEPLERIAGWLDGLTSRPGVRRTPRAERSGLESRPVGARGLQRPKPEPRASGRGAGEPDAEEAGGWRSW